MSKAMVVEKLVDPQLSLPVGVFDTDYSAS